MDADGVEPGFKLALAEINPEALFADGFDDAYVGWIENRWVETGNPVAVYSQQKCVAILVGQGMSEEEAWDYFEFNVAGSYVGPNTPMFLMDKEED